MADVPLLGSQVSQCSCASCSGFGGVGARNDEVAPAVCSGFSAQHGTGSCSSADLKLLLTLRSCNP